MRVKLLHKKNKGLIALATIASLFMSCDKKKGQDNTNNNESQKIVGYVYTSTNGEGGNQIIKLARYSDGTLGQEKVYETGGKGGSDSSAPVNGDYDSQGAIQIIDNHLLAANTGDNTVTVF